MKQFHCPKCEEEVASHMVSEWLESFTFAGEAREILRRQWACDRGHAFQTSGGSKEDATVHIAETTPGKIR